MAPKKGGLSEAEKKLVDFINAGKFYLCLVCEIDALLIYALSYHRILFDYKSFHVLKLADSDDFLTGAMLMLQL